MGKYGIDPMKDYLPYIVGFCAWIESLNWIVIISVFVAMFRAWIAYKEYKLKERIEDGKTKD